MVSVASDALPPGRTRLALGPAVRREAAGRPPLARQPVPIGARLLEKMMNPGFSLVTWNVNSVRARLDNVLTYLDEHDPDVVCLQETKVEDRLFPRVPFMELGYTVSLHGTKGHAGVATLTKQAPEDVTAGFVDGPADRHPRVLSCRVHGVVIYNLYVPNGQSVGSEAYRYKLEWLERLRGELQANRAGDEVLLCGDFNIAPADADVWDVAAMQGSTHVSPPEREALARLREFGLQDCYRRHHDESGRFTWFDYRANSWAKRHGLRIDLVLATRRLHQSCAACEHDYEPRDWDTPSDHIPVRATFSPA
ncbi:MAG: exodeoxyribonuclease III [Myxococcales bacterium FL481]|nr:MAG: exodeoxyribonuclease III [Myxococcales bacterium FL481]